MSIYRPVNFAALPSFFSFEDIPEDQIISTSYLGTPIYSNLIFEANPDTPENEPFVMNSVVMAISKTKSIVQTAIQGRPGTVKEYINEGDFSIGVRGKIVSENQLVAPEAEVIALKNLLNLPSTLEVSSFFLQYFDIVTVVVQDYQIAEVPGSRNEFDFFLNMISDTPIELQLNANTPI